MSSSATDLADQWTSYGWNVLTLDDGHDYAQIVDVLERMEHWDPKDRRPMIVDGKTVKGYWPGATDGKIPGAGDQLVSYPSHPYAMKMNSDYFVALAATFENRYGVEFSGIRQGPVTDTRERLIQFKTNIDVVMSVLDQRGIGDWVADRLVEIGDQVKDKFPLRIDVTRDPFLDERLRVAKLPEDPQTLAIKNPVSGAQKEIKVALFRKPGEAAGARRAISEVVKWLNYVTENRVLTIAADLSESVNLEHGNLWGHYDPVRNPAGTRLKAAIQEAGNASTAIGLVGQNASVDPDKFAGVWAFSGTYGAFTPLMYLPARVWSQQNQDSKFRTGVLHILAGHSGPETAADARTHFGIFAPQVWKLFPRGQAITLNFWDYNDVAAGYFAAAEIAAREKKVGVIIIEVARPDFPVADRSRFADTDLKAAAKGFYVIRDFAPGKARHGYVVAQGSSSTFNLVSLLPKLDEAGLNVKIISAISEELFDRQPEAYRKSVLPPEALADLMVVSTGTRRVWPLKSGRSADRRILADLRLGQPMADGRHRGRRHCGGAPGRRLDFRRDRPVCERPTRTHGAPARVDRDSWLKYDFDAATEVPHERRALPSPLRFSGPDHGWSDRRSAAAACERRSDGGIHSDDRRHPRRVLRVADGRRRLVRAVVQGRRRAGGRRNQQRRRAARAAGRFGCSSRTTRAVPKKRRTP